MKATDQVIHYVGKNILPYANKRVVCPPGTLERNGKPNLMVATPRRSGTHVTMDLLLNNLPDYRRRPLYVDLDMILWGGERFQTELDMLCGPAGYVIKTHFPLRLNKKWDREGYVRKLIPHCNVVCVRRPLDEVIRSDRRWVAASQDGPGKRVSEDDLRHEYERFWAFWSEHQHLELAFRDLFNSNKVSEMIAGLTDQDIPEPSMPAKKSQKNRIYASKAMTRLLGRNAPRIDTSIFTLK